MKNYNNPLKVLALGLGGAGAIGLAFVIAEAAQSQGTRCTRFEPSFSPEQSIVCALTEGNHTYAYIKNITANTCESVSSPKPGNRGIEEIFTDKKCDGLSETYSLGFVTNEGIRHHRGVYPSAEWASSKLTEIKNKALESLTPEEKTKFGL